MESLRRRCERRLRGLRIPEPFDLDAFCREIESRRGRRLLRRPVPGLSSGAPCGLWVGTAGADHVFYDPGTSPLHAEHIVLHELAHILSGHAIADNDSLAALFPDLDPATVRQALGDQVLGDQVLGDQVLGDQVLGDQVLGDQVLGDQALGDQALGDQVLGRVAYTTAQEREAEMMASLIRGRSARPSRTTLGRVAHALGFEE